LTSTEKKTVNYFELVPMRLCEHIVESSGLVTVLVPRFRKEFWKKLLPERLTERDIKIHLDELGSAVWQQMDGNNNVRTICNHLNNTFGEKMIQTEERVTKFITQLFGNNMISFKQGEV
jgi:hydroxylamine reductase (hybrid-cluster protein)